MTKRKHRSVVMSSEFTRKLVAEGEAFIARSRDIRALLERLIAQGEEHQGRMFQFKNGRDLNRAEAEREPILST